MAAASMHCREAADLEVGDCHCAVVQQMKKLNGKANAPLKAAHTVHSTVHNTVHNIVLYIQHQSHCMILYQVTGTVSYLFDLANTTHHSPPPASLFNRPPSKFRPSRASTMSPSALAFIVAPLLPVSRVRLRTSRATAPLAPRRAITVWRCCAAVPPQQEGALSGDDDGLQAALSKGWGELSLFDHTDPTKPPPIEKVVRDPALTDDATGALKDDSNTPDLVAAQQDDQGDEPVAAEVSSEKTEETIPVDADTVTDPAGESEKPAAAEAPVAEEPSTKKKKRGRPPTKAKAKPRVTSRPKNTSSSEDEDDEPKELVAELLDLEDWSEDPHWYFIQVKPGCEQSCAVSIRNMGQSLERLDILEVLVPSTKIMRLTKGGKAVEKEERFFPGYILALMVMNRNTYSSILGVPNIQWFMGDPNRDKKKNQPFRPPLPVSDTEMKNVFEKMRHADSTETKRKTSLRPGDFIRVISGSFEGSEGSVMEVKPDLNVVKCSLILFSRRSVVELEFDQLEVIPELTNAPKKQTEDLEEELSEYPNRSVGKKGSKRDAKARKRRIDAMIKDIDYSNAGVASSADDLAQLLADDESDLWDPTIMQPLPGESKAVQNPDAAFDEFVSSVAMEDEESLPPKPSKKKGPKKKKRDDFEDLFSGDGLISSNDDLSKALSNDEDSDLWGSSHQKASTENDSTDDNLNISDLKDDSEQGTLDDELLKDDFDPEVDDILKGVFDGIGENLGGSGQADDDDSFVEAESQWDEEDEDAMDESEAAQLAQLRKLGSNVPPVDMSNKDGGFNVGADPDDLGEPVIHVEGEEKFRKIDLNKEPEAGDFADVDQVREDSYRETVLYGDDAGYDMGIMKTPRPQRGPSERKRKAKSNRW